MAIAHLVGDYAETKFTLTASPSSAIIEVKR
jgi:hypothetical protein